MMDFTKDSHIHTWYSPDADPEATFEGYIEQAIRLGLTELTFTDHVDFDAVHPLFHNMIDYEDYIQAFRLAQKNAPIPIKLGVEIGYQSHVKQDIKTFLATYPFDFVILSLHYLEGKDLYTQEYFAGKTEEEAYRIYFETLLEAVQTMDEFDVIGHFDYIPRYSPYGDYDYAMFQDIIDDILQTLIQKGKGLEINTSGYKTEGRAYPRVEVLRRFVELGGTRITVGSDSHRYEELGRNFEQLKAIQKAILG